LAISTGARNVAFFEAGETIEQGGGMTNDIKPTTPSIAWVSAA